MDAPAGNGHMPIHNREAEEALLGSLLIDPDAISQVSDFLTVSDLYIAQNRAVYETMLKLHADGRAHADLIAVMDALAAAPATPKNGWEGYLVDLMQIVPTSIHAREYARIVEERAIRRRLLRAAESIATSAHDAETPVGELLDAAEMNIFDVRGRRELGEVAKPRAYTSRFLERFERLRNGSLTAAGLPTGFIDLDTLLDGLQAPHQYVLAGRPAMGKSALALNIAAHLAIDRGKRVLLFSLEMSEHQIANRITAWLTGINSRQRADHYNDHQVAQLYEAAGALSESGLFIDTTEGVSPAQIRAKALRVYAEHGLDLIVVDHLHLMRPDRDMKRPDLEIGETSWSLSNLGKRLNAPVLTLAQLSRAVEARNNKRPNLSDLRESGRIEENAYCVMFLYREAYYNELSERGDTAEVIVAKHREGPTGSVDLYWKAETASFHNLAIKSLDI